MTRSERLPRLHVIVGDGTVGADDYRSRIRPILEAGRGALALHLRTRNTATRRLFEAAHWLSRAARKAESLVVVNDRVDVGVAAGAGGVHLREDSLPVPVARRLAGEQMCLGKSIHSAEQVEELRGSGLDYLVLGAIFPTRSHPGRPALGVEALTAAVAGGDLPVLAIGGITPAEVPGVVARGAHGVVVLGGVWRARNPPRAVARYLEALHEQDGMKTMPPKRYGPA